MHTDLRLAQRDWLALRKHCAPSFRSGFPPETGAIGLVGECRTASRHEYLVARICWPEPGDILTATSGALVFSSTYIRRAHLAMRAAQLAGLVTFHTHPHADQHVRFSPFDNAQDPQLVENLVELEPRTRLVSVV